MGDLAIKKAIYYINESIHLDSGCGDKRFYDSITYMQDAESICLEIERNLKNSNTQFVFNQVINITDVPGKEMISALSDYASAEDGKIKKLCQRKLEARTSEFYAQIGDMFDKTKIIDSLVKRNNKFFYDNNLPYLRTTREEALNEFSRVDRNMAVNFTKMTFWFNKLAKYTDYIMYYTNYKKDTSVAVSGNEVRNLYVSKLKTNFIEAVYKDCLEHNSNEDEAIIENADKYKEDYENLFGLDFKQLDLLDDLKRMKEMQKTKNDIYALKNGLATYAIAELYIDFQKNKTASTISQWGICKDNNNKRYILGVDLKGYPMPITLHLSHEYLWMCLEAEKVARHKYTRESVLPSYAPIRTKNAKGHASTNLLYIANQQQRDKLKADAAANPNNELIQRLNMQVNRPVMAMNQQATDNNTTQITLKELEKLID